MHVYKGERGLRWWWRGGETEGEREGWCVGEREVMSWVVMRVYGEAREV
jgi:hypothetical protein